MSVHPTHILLKAADRGHLGKARQAIEAGADINERDRRRDGNSSLKKAISGGHLPVVELLLENGAEINIQDMWNLGITELMVAAKFNNPAIVKLLIAHNADTTSTDYFGRTALHFAAHNSEIVNIILGAARNKLSEEKFREFLDTAREDAENFTALCCAAHMGNVDAVKILLEAGASVKIDNTSFSTLKHASLGQSLEILRMVIKAGADLQETDNSGQTVLHITAVDGSIKGLSNLIEIAKETLNAEEYTNFLNKDNNDEYTALELTENGWRRRPKMARIIRKNSPCGVRRTQTAALAP